MFPKTSRAMSVNPVDQAIAGCRRHFVSVAVFSAFSNILFVAPTLYLMQVYDRVLPTGGLTTLLLLSAIVAAALAAQSVLDWVRSRLLVRAGAQLDLDFSVSVVDAALSRSGGDLRRTQAMRDFDTLRQGLGGSGLLSILDAPWGVLYLLLTVLIHPLLGLLAAVTGVVMVIVALLNERRTKEPMTSANEAAALSYSTLEAASRSVGLVGALGMRRALAVKHIRERSTMIQLQSQGSFRASGYSSINKTIRIVVQSAAVGLGAWLVVKGSMSGGSMMAASFLLARALAPIEQITAAWPMLDKTRHAYRALKALFAGRGDEAERTGLPAPKGRILVEGVSVSLGGDGRQVLHDLTFSLDPGTIVGVAGGSGSGKSTLARTLVGATPVSDGVIRFDGAALSDWDPEALGRHIGYLPQDFTLFEGTVKQNISRFYGFLGGSAEAIDQMVIKAARLVGAHDMILGLPAGYDTPLGIGGTGLSGGQTQRVALARAFFGSPPIVVLDEPNAHLDGASEQRLMEAMSAARNGGATVVVMAHSRALLGMADRLIVLDNGRLDLAGPLADVAALMRERRSGPRTAPEAAPATVDGSPEHQDVSMVRASA